MKSATIKVNPAVLVWARKERGFDDSEIADKLGKDLSYRKKAEEELVVIDPLEKARTLKEDKRATRNARSGGSSRAWDKNRDRDSKGR